MAAIEKTKIMNDFREKPTRRKFLTSTVAAASAGAAPYFLTARVTQATEVQSKNDRIRIGLIGAGNMGVGNLEAANDWCDVVAIADVDGTHAARANKKLSQGKAVVYSDYRRVLERTDLDALHIATPDHWHAKVLVEAMLAGFDVYCEKPLTLTIDEGKLIRKVRKETGRIVQVGTQQRSTFDLFVKAIAIVQAGRLGRIKKLQAAIGGAPESASIPVAKHPTELDWDRWLGPAPLAEYRRLDVKQDNRSPQILTNCHNEFRWWYDYSGGTLTDWGAHHVDIAIWALAANGQPTAPQSIGGEVTHPVPFKDGYPVVNDRYHVATKFVFQVALPDGVELIIRDDTRNGVLIEGDKGRIFVNRGELAGKPVENLLEDPLPEDAIHKAYKGFPMVSDERKAHWANFVHCLRERQEPISDIDSHLEALDICHLATLSGRLGRSLQWDSQQQQIVGDDQANEFLSRTYRKGYEIDG
jgi:predicted dehydrogenase